MPAKKVKPPVPAQVSPPDTRSGVNSRRTIQQQNPMEQRLSKIEETLEKIAAIQEKWAEEPQQQGRPVKSKPGNIRGRRSVSLELPSNNSMEEGFNSVSSNVSRQPPQASPVDAESGRHAGTRQAASHQPQRLDPNQAQWPTDPNRNVNNNTRPVTAINNNNLTTGAWANWMDGANRQRQSTATSSYNAPMPQFAFHQDDVESQVQQILATTAHTLSRGNVKPGAYPYKYVSLGYDRKHLNLNTVTLAEHLWGILRMVKNEKTDPEIVSAFPPRGTRNHWRPPTAWRLSLHKRQSSCTHAHSLSPLPGATCILLFGTAASTMLGGAAVSTLQ